MKDRETTVRNDAEAVASRGLAHDLILLGAGQVANQVVPPLAAKVKETFTPTPKEESPLILPPGADRE